MRLFKACIFVATAAVIAAGLSLPSSAPLFAGITASLVDNLGLQPVTNRSTAITQSTTDTETLTPADSEAPPPKEIAAAAPADQTQAGDEEPRSDVLFKQFQSWAAAQANVAPIKAVQDAPEKVVQDAPTRFGESTRKPLPLVQKRRDARRLVREARSEASTRNLRKPLRLAVQHARAQMVTAQGESVRAQEPVSANPSPSIPIFEPLWTTLRSP
jgi:hypothetical protein